MLKTIRLALFGLLLGSVNLLSAATVDDLCASADDACMKGDMAAALDYAERAVQDTPDSWDAQWRLVRSLVDQGEIAQDAGDEDAAEQWYNRALESSKSLVEAHPGYSMSHYYRALALGRRAMFAGGKEKVQLSQEIEKQALAALELDEENGSAHGLIGRYYREMAHLSWVMRKLAETLFGDLPDGGDQLSYDHLKRATELRPDWVFAWVELGETCEVMDRKDEAKACYQKALDLPASDHRDGIYQATAKERL